MGRVKTCEKKHKRSKEIDKMMEQADVNSSSEDDNKDIDGEVTKMRQVGRRMRLSTTDEDLAKKYLKDYYIEEKNVKGKATVRKSRRIKEKDKIRLVFLLICLYDYTLKM
ncbi:hypothetical protein AAHE18_10G061100 [Arachis hypogaea]|nr:uncharacterized protein DS421_10g293970 [Arachis hypogaea]